MKKNKTAPHGLKIFSRPFNNLIEQANGADQMSTHAKQVHSDNRLSSDPVSYLTTWRNKRQFIQIMAAAALFFVWIQDAIADNAKRVSGGGFAFWMLADGPIAGRVVWVFDRPGKESDPKGLLLSHIKKASTVEWASYKPTHPEIVDALNGHSAASGVYDQNYCGKNCTKAFGGNDRVKSIALGVYKSKSKRRWFVMHHKFAVLRGDEGDGVLTGSFNWNKRATDLNFENLVYVKSSKLAETYSQVFGVLPAGASVEVMDGDISAGFNKAGMELMRRQIEAAQESILVAVWSISVASKKNPNPIYDALVAAAERGVDVQIVTDYHKAKKRKYRKLAVHSVRMPSKKAHMHHKFMVIDSAHVVSGSYNFVTKSFSGNYENVVAIKSPAMAASFADHWRELRDYEP